MSQSQTRIRRTPKTPFLVGNLMLAFFAVYLVFFGPDPWSMSTVLLVVLCMLTGGVLALFPFLLDQWLIANLNRMRALQAGMNLRAALDRSEKVLEGLDNIQREESPVRLIAERLPELVENKLLEAQEKADSDATAHREHIRKQLKELSGTVSLVEKLQESLESIAAHYATREYVETGIARIREDLHKLSVQVGEVQRISTLGRSSVPVRNGTAPAQENAASSEAVHQKNPATNLEGRTSSASSVEDATGERAQEGGTGEERAVAPPPSEAKEKETFVSTETSAPSNATKSETSAPPVHAEKVASKSKETTLTVSSFIGIQNHIYLRANGPGYSMEKGERLNVTGIGEWQWKGDLEQSMDCELWLNDEKPAKGGRFSLRPGEKKIIQPEF